ncbi:erythromycin esterase family protein [Nonomuraea sp. NPDC050394]|uniref:erythromycin esterase family protein n=1 Tax=Nonomuraea sp. NPDC050394 TaxID=3364363 RepID=UPI0037B45DCE
MNIIESRSLDPMDPLDDLEPLLDLVGDARVVAIGESSHHVREFYLLRHRLLRFLVERRGFTVYALEAPFTDAHTIDAWVRGGAGTVEQVASAGIDHGMGDCREMHDLLRWMREHERPLRFAGCLAGVPRTALRAVAAYVKDADPDAFPLADRAFRLAGGDREVPSMKAMMDHARRPIEAQDELTVAISRLLARMETMAGYQRGQGRGAAHAAAFQHLRNAWYLDHGGRDLGGRGMAVGTACLDAFGAESVLRLVEDGARVVVATHNTHIRKTVIEHEGDFGLFPQGYHLARALGPGYVSIAATSLGGRTSAGRVAPGHPLGFEAVDVGLPALAEGSVETLFDGRAPLAIADLRGHDPEAFTRIRMLDSFMDVPVVRAYDAVACVPETRSVQITKGPFRQG